MTKHYRGGYYLHREPLIRGEGSHAHTAADLTQISNYTVNAVNYIQATPWAINEFVLNVVQRFASVGADVAVSGDKVALRIEEPVYPPHDPNCLVMQRLPDERWAAMTKEEKTQHRADRQHVMEVWKSELGEYRNTALTIHLAEEMASVTDQFFYPHNMDFRTRIYPIPNTLTPQSSDLSKGLLRFARPTPLGLDGYFWMGFTVASHYGEDKLRPEERVKWAQDNLDMIEPWVDDPHLNRGWMEADKPFQFLAVAHEWVWAHRSGDPKNFMSHLPGNLDGSCNGAQHLSIMARDVVGATATNCRSDKATGGKRYDLYMEVADRVWEQVQEDCLKAHPMALKWRSKMDKPSARRKVVKRAVMTVPYGVTDRGVAEFMISDRHVDKGRDQWDQAKYMRDLILGAVDQTLNQGRNIQAWLMECASICAEENKPLVWDTPAGTKVTQAYRNLIEKRIKSFASTFYIYEEPKEDEDGEEFMNRIGFDKQKMATAAPPNVVHSCDASHLQITVNRMWDAGIRDFSMIHDSFGCPFAYVGIMRDILRQAIVDMYQDNYLLKWKESVEGYTGVTLPDPPPLGDFDLNEILESEFFFS